MSQFKAPPRLTSEGILFTVTVDCFDYECLIKTEALQHLTALNNHAGKAVDTADVFHVFENKINGIARRLISAGVQGKPLVLNQNTLTPPNRR